MKLKHTLILLAICSTTAFAQDEKVLNLSMEVRADYQKECIDGNTINEDTGFKGKLFNLILKGKLNDKFSYYLRERLNNIPKSKTIFDATDMLYINYEANKNITLSAGKQAVGIGGFEYDAAPIDIYSYSEYCNNIPCFKWGFSGTYHIKNKNNITFQFSESPFGEMQNNSNMYAYNMMWTSNYGFFKSIYSVNMLEYQPNKYINYIVLGNQFSIKDKVIINLDIMNRASSTENFFFDDMSIMSKIVYKVCSLVNVSAKYTYDVNTSHTGDYCVLPGTEMNMIGAGVEVFPLKNNKLRAHTNIYYSWGTNTNPSGTLNNKQTHFDLGLTWRTNLL